MEGMLKAALGRMRADMDTTLRGNGPGKETDEGADLSRYMPNDMKTGASAIAHAIFRLLTLAITVGEPNPQVVGPGDPVATELKTLQCKLGREKFWHDLTCTVRDQKMLELEIVKIKMELCDVEVELLEMKLERNEKETERCEAETAGPEENLELGEVQLELRNLDLILQITDSELRTQAFEMREIGFELRKANLGIRKVLARPRTTILAPRKDLSMITALKTLFPCKGLRDPNTLRAIVEIERIAQAKLEGMEALLQAEQAEQAERSERSRKRIEAAFELIWAQQARTRRQRARLETMREWTAPTGRLPTTRRWIDEFGAGLLISGAEGPAERAV